MTIKLDKIDHKILYLLDLNTRVPFSFIGKKIRKSPQYVKYRVDRLRKEKVIQSIAFLPGIPKGYSETYMYIKLRASGITDEKLLLNFLLKLKETHQLYFCDGNVEIIATLLTKDHTTLERIRKETSEQFEHIIDSISFNGIYASKIFSKKYLVPTEPAIEKEIPREVSELSSIQKKMLETLNSDPFISQIEISEKLKTSYDKVKYAFKNEPPFKISYLTLSNQFVRRSLLFIAVDRDVESITTHAKFNESITGMDKILGKFNIVLRFECPSNMELSRIIKEFLYTFKDQIRTSQKIDVNNVYKQRWIPR